LLLMRKFRDIAMVERSPFILGTMALVVFWAVATTQATEFGTREEAKAMLEPWIPMSVKWRPAQFSSGLYTHMAAAMPWLILTARKNRSMSGS